MPVLLALLLCFILLSNMQIPETPQPQQNLPAKEVAKKPAEKMRSITLHYDVRFDSVYTGAVTYIPHKGSKTFTVEERALAYSGMPVTAMFPFSATIEFDCTDGQTCQLFVPTNGKQNSLHETIPAAEEAILRYPAGFSSIEKRTYFLSARVIKKDADNFLVFVAPDKTEIDSMVREAGFQI